MLITWRVVTIVMQHGKFSQFILQLKNELLSEDRTRMVLEHHAYPADYHDGQSFVLVTLLRFCHNAAKFLQTQEES
jgi:hypothetical protein